MEYRKVHRKLKHADRVDWLYASFDDDGHAVEILMPGLGHISPDEVPDWKLQKIFERVEFESELAVYSPSGCRERSYRKWTSGIW